MKAKLKNGEIVALEKNCHCMDSIHDGPHWLYSNDLWRQLNQEKMTTATSVLTWAWLAQDEARRLKERGDEMERRGIVEIIREE